MPLCINCEVWFKAEVGDCRLCSNTGLTWDDFEGTAVECVCGRRPR